MIESSILSSSPWDNDLIQEFSLDIENSFIFGTEDYVCNFETTRTESSLGYVGEDISSSSSDNEQLVFDDLNFLSVSDTFVSQILDENNAFGLSDFDWAAISDSPTKHNTSPSESSNLCQVSKTTNSSKVKKKRPLQYLSSSKPWSKMTSEEQLQTLYALSEIVTCHMDIRAQMIAIKIIDPSAVITPDDKEFALDGSFLNDSKFKKLKEFVRKNAFLPSNNTKPMNSSSKNKIASKKTNSYSRSHLLKQRQKKQKVPSNTKLIERKFKRQGRKEVQSGLFVYEKKIKLLSQPSEEDEDVNILE